MRSMPSGIKSLNGRAAMAYLSFPSLKDTQAQRHTAEIIAPLSYGPFEAHRDEPWRRRGVDYESAKDRITRALLDLVERHHPGFGDLVEYAELATPLTFEHFTAAPSGAIYGYPATPQKYRKTWLGPSTPIQNLYLTGSDVALLGIMGAVMGAVVTASCLLGPFGFVEVMRAANSHPGKRGSQKNSDIAHKTDSGQSYRFVFTLGLSAGVASLRRYEARHRGDGRHSVPRSLCARLGSTRSIQCEPSKQEHGLP